MLISIYILTQYTAIQEQENYNITWNSALSNFMNRGQIHMRGEMSMLHETTISLEAYQLGRDVQIPLQNWCKH